MSNEPRSATGRLLTHQRGEPGGSVVIHRFWGAEFVHNYDNSCKCPCAPIIIPGTDKRSLDEIVDDLGDEVHYAH